GKHPYQLWGMHKSWEGTGTMAIASGVVSLAILFAVNGISWPVLLTAVVVTLVATGLEAFSKFGIDNLTVPLGSAGVGYGLIQWWVG
ncbi:MAG: phosphatidate cytidylyltransferase, partial [Thermosynechococcaceae cyanobacterium]